MLAGFTLSAGFEIALTRTKNKRKVKGSIFKFVNVFYVHQSSTLTIIVQVRQIEKIGAYEKYFSLKK